MDVGSVLLVLDTDIYTLQCVSFCVKYVLNNP